MSDYAHLRVSGDVLLRVVISFDAHLGVSPDLFSIGLGLYVADDAHLRVSENLFIHDDRWV
jgi:hypothetical protein